jgi:cytosine/uracil/thiamine/allantoin permease
MSKSERLYNLDLAPTSKDKKNWGWFEIFNVWANDVQSLFGYTLAASLFLYSGLNGWAVAVDMLGSLVHHLAHWFIWQSHANKPSHHKLGIAHHVSIGGLFHLSPSFLPLFMDRLCFAISLS